MRAGAYGGAEAVGGPRQFAGMTPHPDIVPAQHRDRGKEDCGVEDLLADARHRRRQCLGKTGNDHRPQSPAGDAAADPKAAVWHPLGRGHNDADDQGRFQHLAKDNDRRCQHPPLLLHDDDAAGRGMEIVKELVAPALQRADIDADRASR